MSALFSNDFDRLLKERILQASESSKKRFTKKEATKGEKALKRKHMRAVYNCKWFAEHPDLVRKYARKSYYKDIEKSRKYHREWMAEYRKNNLEKCRANVRKWKAKNKEKVKADREKWFAEHPEKRELYNARQREKRRLQKLARNSE